MSLLAATTGLTTGLLGKIALSAWAAAIGVTVAFSAAIYCADRAGTYRRVGRRGPALAFSGAGVAAGVACLGLIAVALITITTK